MAAVGQGIKMYAAIRYAASIQFKKFFQAHERSRYPNLSVMELSFTQASTH
jgi:hypothetical protein